MLERAPELARVRKTVLRTRRERLHHHPIEQRRNAERARTNPHRFGRRLHLQFGKLDRRACDERQAPRAKLVKNGAKCVHVGARIHLDSASLLGRHVFGRARDGEFAVAVRWLTEVVDGLGDPEIEDLQASRDASQNLGIFEGTGAREEQVGGLQVAMDHADRVGRLEPSARENADRDRVAERQAPLTRKALLERLAAQELHRAPSAPTRGFAEVVDHDEVRVTKPRDRLRLAPE